MGSLAAIIAASMLALIRLPECDTIDHGAFLSDDSNLSYHGLSSGYTSVKHVRSNTVDPLSSSPYPPTYEPQGRAANSKRQCLFARCAEPIAAARPEPPRPGLLQQLINSLTGGKPRKKEAHGPSCYCRPLVCKCLEVGWTPLLITKGSQTEIEEPNLLYGSCDLNARCVKTPNCKTNCPQNTSYDKCICYTPNACVCLKDESLDMIPEATEEATK